MRGRSTPPPDERAISDLATRQGGVVSRDQLLRLGLGRRAIGYRLRLGRLTEIHRGVYAVGHRSVPREGRWRAALLGAPSGAVLSHFTAGALWDITVAGSAVHLSVPGRSGRLRLDGVVA